MRNDFEDMDVAKRIAGESKEPCEKIRYFSINDANYAKKHLKHVGAKRVYQCVECGKLGMGPVWHLTSQK